MKVLTIGSFELLHVGHLNLFEACRKLAGLNEYGRPDAVIVGVNSDRFVKQYKGFLPIVNESQRRRLIEAMGYTTVLNDGAGRNTIVSSRPDCLVVGSDWASKDYYAQINMTAAELRQMGIILVFVPYTQGISTTELKRRINDR